jgi:hypothetical protein
MPANNELNDAPVLDQMREHWQKLLALVLWKARRDGRFEVKISTDDIEAMNAAFGNNATIFTHATGDTIYLSLITKEQAELIAAHQAGIKGRA